MRLPPFLERILDAFRDDCYSLLQGLQSDIKELIRTMRDQQAAYRQQENNAQSFNNNLPERIIRAEREIKEYTERENRT